LQFGPPFESPKSVLAEMFDRLGTELHTLK